jgi:quercetin dioxygenase-like cupin family protein
MPEQAQSIRRGSNRLTSRDVGLFQVTNVAFAPATTLPSHYHERTCFAVVLEGTVEKVFTRNRHTSAAGSVVTMPAGEQHADHFAGDGAQLLVVEPQSGPEAQELLHPCASILQSVQHVRDSHIVTLAWRVHRELHDPDPVSSLAVSGYVLEMLAQAARAQKMESSAKRVRRPGCAKRASICTTISINPSRLRTSPKPLACIPYTWRAPSANIAAFPPAATCGACA